MRKIKLLILFTLMTGVFFTSLSVLAVPCPPGIPCIVSKTPNDPDNPNDGPNAPAAPNAPKADATMCTQNNRLYCACDADFMNQIYAKSYLESQRENIFNEVLVRKPESVLQYTCFNAEMKRLEDPNVPVEQRLSYIFSEAPHWDAARNGMYSTVSLRPSIGGIASPGMPSIGPVPMPSVVINVNMGVGRLRGDLSRVVTSSVYNYILQNYCHAPLGGPGCDTPPPPLCYIMNEVYFYAKCFNFGVDAPFYSMAPLQSDPRVLSSFSALVTTDPRLLPWPCTSGTNISDNLIKLSKNTDFQYVNFDEINPSYVDRYKPKPCLPPLPTGVMVKKAQGGASFSGVFTFSSPQLYPDKICVNPSCFYDPNADRCQ